MGEATFAIQDDDRGMAEIMRSLATLSKAEITIGIHAVDGAKAYAKGKKNFKATTAFVGAVHEFGAPSRGIPQRSFLRATVDSNSSRIEGFLFDAVAAVIDRVKDPMQAANTVGLQVVGLVAKRIVQGIPPALKPATIERKGSSTPLIDTGQLRQSIRHVAKVDA